MIDCPRCETGKMLVSRQDGVIAQCVNCGHEIAEIYSPSSTTAMWIAKAHAEQQRMNEVHAEAQTKRQVTLAAKRTRKG